MTERESKFGTGELDIIYMNGSVIPLTGHELVAALRSPSARMMLLATVVLLSLPSTAGLAEDESPGVRVLVNVVAVLVFISLLPPLLFDALNRARLKGKRRVYLFSATVPAAVLSTLSAESLGVLVSGAGFSRVALAAKLGLGLVFWEAIVFLGVWYYGPVLGRQTAADAQAPGDSPALMIKGLRIDPEDLRRIETAGRLLHVHVGGTVHTVSARMQDVAPLLEPHGMMVHRCHWVAHAALGPVTVKGRSYEMTTVHGDNVPVSRDRRDAVRAALARATQP